MFLLRLLSLVSLSFGGAGVVLQYNFGTNFGQVFNDTSGNGLFAVNGNSWSSSSNNQVLMTDRGAYFSSSSDGNSYITLPPNDYTSASFGFGTTMSVSTWVNLKDISTTSSPIFRRVPSTASNQNSCSNPSSLNAQAFIYAVSDTNGQGTANAVTASILGTSVQAINSTLSLSNC
jgi:hypothetical protein